MVDVSSITKRGKPRIRGLKGERRKTRLNRKVIRDSGQAYTTTKRGQFPLGKCCQLPTAETIVNSSFLKRKGAYCLRIAGPLDVSTPEPISLQAELKLTKKKKKSQDQEIQKVKTTKIGRFR